MATTIEEVANAAGVSTATVSRVLRGLPNVAPSTRDRVLQAAQELNYSIDPQIFRIARGRKLVAVLQPLADTWFFNKVNNIAEQHLVEMGYEVVRYSVNSLDYMERLLTQLTQGRQVDGFIVTSLPISSRLVNQICEAKIPMVSIEQPVDHCPVISIDNSAAAELATRHLLNLGHRRIGLITGVDSESLNTTIPDARREGYRRALSNYGIEYRQKYEASGNFSYEGGAEAMKRLFSLHQPPSAIFAVSDEMAIGALKTIRDLNLRIPADFSIIGFDDNDVSAYIELTTIRQPVLEFGRTATELLLDQINEPEPDKILDRKIQLESSLIVRSTTGPLIERR